MPVSIKPMAVYDVNPAARAKTKAINGMKKKLA